MSVLSCMKPVAPRWATACGRDQYGPWADLEIESVVQRLRWMSPGDFLMGSSAQERRAICAEDPVSGELLSGLLSTEALRHVYVTCGFWLADTVVTRSLWNAVMGGPGATTAQAQLPVCAVNWYEAGDFLHRLGRILPGLAARLPYEAEWEYACRAGTAMRYWYGEAFAGDEAQRSLLPVAQGLANHWGLYDMHGGVWEWCQDWFAMGHVGAVATDPQGPEQGTFRVLRGGSYNGSAIDCRAASRDGCQPSLRRDDVGFRLAIPQSEDVT